PVPPAAQAPPAKTAVIQSAKTGRTYTVVPMAEPEGAGEPIEAVSALGAPSSDNFRGTDRAGAKTSIVDGDPPTFDDVTARASWSTTIRCSTMIRPSSATPTRASTRRTTTS